MALISSSPTETASPPGRALGFLIKLATAPVIYLMLVPVAFLDLMVSLYQAICFTAWGIARTPRSPYLVVDRYRLAYLNPLQRVHCAYCGYANGVLAYAREIAARTEQFWCPIKHERAVPDPHEHYDAFVAYGDASEFGARARALRAALAAKDGEAD